MGEGGRVVPPLAQLRLCTQDPGLAGGGQDTDLAAPPTGPPGDSTRTPASSLPAVRERWRGSPATHIRGPTPASGRAGPLQPAAPSSSSVRAETSPTRQGRPALFFFPRSCLGQTPGRRAASLRGPRRADRPPNGATAGSCPTSSPSWVTPTAPGALGKHRVDWGQLPVTQGPSAGPEEGGEDREALTERGGTAKGSGTIWRLKPGQQGRTPREGRWGGSALGTWAWKVLEGNSREAGAVPSPRAGQRLAEACPGGDGLVGSDPSPEPLAESPLDFWVGRDKGQRL